MAQNEADTKAAQIAGIRKLMGSRGTAKPTTPPGAPPGNGGDPTDEILGRLDQGMGQAPPRLAPPEQDQEMEEAGRAEEIREAVLAAQDRIILGTILVDIFERFSPNMTPTETMVMLHQIELYNPAYVRRHKAAMQQGGE